MSFKHLIKDIDPDISEAIANEIERLEYQLQMIPSENVLDDSIMQAQGSVLTTKYAEGYPGKRYYGGCEFVDVVENLAIDRAKKLFNCEFANVQPHSGSSANFAILFSLLKPGDTIMGMSLQCGGHLTHGYGLNFSGKLFKSYSYNVNRKTELIDYDEVLAQVKEVKPRLIICGATAYPREIDFKAFREIADSVGALLLADISHIAGLVVAGAHQSPIPYADVTMTTTHKTLGGPRGGVILTNNHDIARLIDKSIIPGTQGGPLMNEIAGKAVAFKLAMSEQFKNDQFQTTKNTKILANELQSKNIRIVSGGTDNHLLIADVSSIGVTGTEAERSLSEAGITVNKNTIPFDSRKPFDPSGVRMGTVIPTRRGMKEDQMTIIAQFVADAMMANNDKTRLASIKASVKELCVQFPYYMHLLEDYKVVAD